MNYRKIISVIILLFTQLAQLMAQQNGDYKKEWDKVYLYDKKGLPQSALEEVKMIFARALKDRNEPQQVKAAMYEMKFRNMVEEDNHQKDLYYLDSLILKTSSPTRNILLSMKADILSAYKNVNRYRLYSRTALMDESSKDIDTWSIAKLNREISSLYKASLRDDKILKITLLKTYDAIIEKGVNTRSLRPTLYDLLAHRALSYFMNSENEVTSPVFKFILNDPAVFAPASAFINTKFISADSVSNFYDALLILQDILRFHQGDAARDAFLDADLARLAFVYEHGVFTNKDSLYEQALLNIEQANPNNVVAARAMFLRAQLYFQQGSQFDPVLKKQYQFQTKKAKELLETIVRDYKGTEAGTSAYNLLLQIDRPQLNFEIEKVNLPGQPFRSLVKYSNIKKLYFRVIKTTHSQVQAMANENMDNSWSTLAAAAPIRNWSVDLPDARDYQQHSVEIKVDALPSGLYVIMASPEPSFRTTNNLLARQVTYVSNISYIINNKNEMYVLDRDNGMPLPKAEVQVWQQSYNSTTRKYEDVFKERIIADGNGKAFLKKPTINTVSNLYFQVKYNNDELFTDENYYQYNYDGNNQTGLRKTFFFTDRAIYRPGQTVQFKGIVIRTDTSASRSSIIPDYQTTLLLLDANMQKAGSLQVTSNEYGSFNGSFVLPAGLMNGDFYLQDSTNKSTQHFKVEEYKRPKFQVMIDKPSGTYRLNEMITVKGNAKAFAGNAIDGAALTYRVVRKVRYPIWLYGGFSKVWPPFQSEQMEIANGQLTTNADGTFKILFKAVPDESVDKSLQPTFVYEVTATVTDVNGETQSGINSILVAYQALQLELDIPAKIPTDSISSLSIRSKNVNNLFEKATVQLSIFKLQAPSKIFRSRYWNQPDQFIMSKEEYYTLFPYDAYADEADPKNWKIEKTVLQQTDTTAADSHWKIAVNSIEPGWYKFVVTSKDKYGEDVKVEKYVQLTAGSSTQDAVTVEVDKTTAQPGETIKYNVSTGFGKIWLINTIVRMPGVAQTSYQTVTSSQPFQQQVQMTEKDRGGMQLGYAFVQHNRVYDGTTIINVPWSDKELQMSFETFRDKILPGAEEKWKIRISGDKSTKIAAETLISMYDASLDKFVPHQWASLTSLWPTLANAISWTTPGFTSLDALQLQNLSADYKAEIQRTYDELLNIGWLPAGYYRGGVVMESVMANAAAPMQSKMDDKIRLRGNAAFKSMPDSAALDQSLQPSPESSNIPVQIRKNFNETAFFFPSLHTDANGNVEFSFTMPEALTEWKLMTLAHTKELASAYVEKKVVTQKTLMVQPNTPRFVREGDEMELSAKLVNMSDKEITGTTQLELWDAATDKPVDGWFKNIFPTQYFTVSAGQSVAVKFPIGIPYNFGSTLKYRIRAVAKDGSLADGEEAALPVLTNRMLVTETFPLNMRNTNSKSFRFDKLLNSSNSGTLTHHALTIEYTSNPAWYAVQALPYLMEYPYECAEQNFNRFYANALASHISNSMPAIKAVFDRWRTLDTSALMSNLQKNEELKSALLQETPWVLQAQDETQQKKNIALLFDMVKMAGAKEKALQQLKETQLSNGGFPWFKGGPDDRYITQYILSGIGHLRKLNVLNDAEYKNIQPIIDKALPYLSARLKEDYDRLIKNKADLKKNQLNNTAIQYLYMRSMFLSYKGEKSTETAYRFYLDEASKFWLSTEKYMQGMIALALHRSGNENTAKAITRSLKENALTSEEMGMYWKEFNAGGYYWHQAPVESQALMIEVFSEVEQNTSTVNDLKTWLLKQKQTTQWHTTKETAEACYALLLTGNNWLAAEPQVTVQLGNSIIKSNEQNSEAGTGYFKKVIPGKSVQQGMGNITVKVDRSPADASGTSWGAVYWQYFEDLDKITTAATALKITKKLFIETNSSRGPVLTEIKEGNSLKIGDKVKVRIELRSDRDLEYVHLKDMRASAFEPVNVISQYKYQGGLGYFESTKDASTSFFFPYISRGTYVFEYPVFVTHTGTFSNGISTVQCMYAPEFSSHSEGVRVNVE